MTQDLLFILPSVALLGAMVIDVLTGEPRIIYRYIAHPAILMGKAVHFIDEKMNRISERAVTSDNLQRLRGVLALILISLTALATGGLLSFVLSLLPNAPGFILEALLASSLIAHRSLHDHVAAVGHALDREGLPAARAALSMIVGRDTEQLDEPAVIRAATESLAENFSDGVIAPCLFYLFFGLPGLLLYKMVNTADSMIGHRTETYEHFGWASARFDDLLNLIPARLTGFLLVLASLCCGPDKARESWRIMRRDAGQHRSPNAGWPESAVAGALGIRLSGPRVYEGSLSDEPWLGDGRETLTVKDLRRALVLVWSAYGLFAMGLVIATSALLP